MKRVTLVLMCALSLGAASPKASAAADIRIWRRHHKDPAKTSAPAAPKKKARKTIFHKQKPTREESARSEVAYGMTGPKSVGHRHPQPGPAGYGVQ